ncbi:MAG: hypothetical protein SW833_15785 [Cyanobacteriota bacterium]|nr:hypothetical protein [Cyanobacteriota bacterium]
MTEIQEGRVGRYCKPTTLENGIPISSAFAKRVKDTYLSVYLLEFFQRQTEEENITEIKNYMSEQRRWKFSPNGCFAVFDIQQSKTYIFEEESLEIFYRDQGLPHCGLFHDNSGNDIVVAKLLAKCVQTTYPIKNLPNSTTLPPSRSQD